jgi:hypothetical protein
MLTKTEPNIHQGDSIESAALGYKSMKTKDFDSFTRSVSQPKKRSRRNHDGMGFGAALTLTKARCYLLNPDGLHLAIGYGIMGYALFDRA